MLVELEAGRSDHPGFPAGLFRSIGNFVDEWEGESWEPDKSRYGCSTGFLLVWVFMAVAH